MLSSNFYPTVLSLSALLALTNGQVFPRCVRTCIDNSQYSNCQVTNFACLCRAGHTSGSFLPDLVNCMHSSCVDLNVDVLLAPFQLGCVLAGAPLSDSAINSAKSRASNLATQTATEMQISTATRTATTEFTRVLQTTITKTEDGSSQTVVIPLTGARTTTVSGEPSTVTRDASGTSTSATSRNLAGLSSVLSSLVSSARSSSSSATSQQSTTNTILTSTTVVDNAATSSTGSSSSTTQSAGATSAPGPQDSAPFTNTNAAGRDRGVTGGSVLGLGFLVMGGAVLF